MSKTIICVCIERMDTDEHQRERRGEVIDSLRSLGCVFDTQRNPIILWAKLPRDGSLSLEDVKRLPGVDDAFYANEQRDDAYIWQEY